MARVMLFGVTGTAGAAVAQALVAAGHSVVGITRRPVQTLIETRTTDITDPRNLARHGFRGERFDVIVSCMASRSGIAKDAWAVDYCANSTALTVGLDHGLQHFVYLSAICVQKPRLAFQKAKQAFEADLRASGIRHSIVRPTAFFKSLSGQVRRMRVGKPYVMFGDGTLTACKPISDRDLADYIVGCIEDAGRHNKTMALGGPGPALTPVMQGKMLADALGQPFAPRRVSPRIFKIAAGVLNPMGRVRATWAEKAELARIGHYYATESMLVWDGQRQCYDADATPEYGSDTLQDHYKALVQSGAEVDLGTQAVF